MGTVLVQSSSVSTATIVGLVGGGLIDVNTAVPMVMGANIGTTVTNTLASLGHVRRSEEFRRAFAAATVHDFFNVLAVGLLLPLELLTGFLSNSAEWLTKLLVGQDVANYNSPLKQAVKLPSDTIKDLLGDFGAEGVTSGTLLLIIGLLFIFVALAFITRNMRAIVADRVERSLNQLLGRSSGLIAILAGLVMTIAVQSSSITTSILIPLAAAGILTLENIYPVTLGANVGTTITALIAAFATSDPRTALTVALAHTLFNITGIVIFYPAPRLRQIPIRLANGLAGLAVQNRVAAIGYVAGAFIVVPLAGILLLR